jgi:hypothetical protein
MDLSLSNPVVIVAIVVVILSILFRDQASLLLQGLHGFANEYNSSYVSDDEDKKD